MGHVGRIYNLKSQASELSKCCTNCVHKIHTLC